MASYWAILVAALANIILGMIWYNPKVFGTKWMELSKVEMKKEGMAASYVGMIVASLIIAVVLSWLLPLVGAMTVTEALKVALLVWLGFTATVQFGDVLWGNHTMTLFFINSLFRLVSFGAMAAILVSWG